MYRPYPRSRPLVGEIVRITVVSIDEHGLMIQLDEYGEIPARAMTSDLIRGKQRQSLRRLFPVGSQDYLEVIECSDTYIGCSKRNVNDQDRQQGQQQWTLNRQLYEVLSSMSKRHGIPLERWYEELVWKTNDESHVYDRLLAKDFDATSELGRLLRQDHEVVFGVKHYRWESELEMVCWSMGGVRDLKRVISGLKGSSVEVKSLPNYVLMTESETDDASEHQEAIQYLVNAFADIGRCVVKSTQQTSQMIQPSQGSSASVAEES